MKKAKKKQVEIGEKKGNIEGKIRELKEKLAGAVTGEKSLIAIGVGLAFSITISFFAEFFSALYHESKN